MNTKMQVINNILKMTFFQLIQFTNKSITLMASKAPTPDSIVALCAAVQRYS